MDVSWKRRPQKACLGRKRPQPGDTETPVCGTFQICEIKAGEEAKIGAFDIARTRGHCAALVSGHVSQTGGFVSLEGVLESKQTL